MESLKKGERILFRREWRASMKRGFLGRNGRSKWTPRRKVKRGN